MTQLIKPPPRVMVANYQRVTLLEDQELGSGAYGKVCRAICDDLPCAAKLLHPVLFKYGDPTDKSVIQRFNNECELLSACKHPCVVQYIATYIHPESGQAVLLMELMDESLTKFLERSKSPIPIYTQINICHDIILALAYLHSNSIIHRDLTGNNVLILAGSRAKVTDFGMLKIVDNQQRTNPQLRQMTMCPGCPLYMAPEALKNPPVYTQQLDIFSFGVVAIQIMTRRFPKRNDERRGSESEKRKSDISSVNLDHPILPIALSCIKDKENHRPTASDVCKKITVLKECPEYRKSSELVRESVSQVECLTKELQEAQEKIKLLRTRLENAQMENEELNQLVSKSITTRTAQILPLTSQLSEQPRVSLQSSRNSLTSSMHEYLDIDDDPYLPSDVMELSISVPPSTVWYHGNITRDMACMRLQTVGIPGAYLIRDSGSEPGSYVLSFLDRQLRVFHYRIVCENGQYNVSGQSKRWFASMQDLIGYYTKYSTVRQNQHLEVPVMPPEVVSPQLPN